MKKVLAIAAGLLLGFISVQAAGTAAYTEVNNDANLTFSVGGVAQTTTVTSNIDTFKVDKKIDMALSQANGGDQVDVVPGLQDANTTWTFVNEGNMDQNFTFAAVNLSGGVVFTKTDNADTESDTSPHEYKYYWDNNGTWTEITGPLPVAVDDNITIRVAVDIPTGASDGDIMNIELNATAVNSSGDPETATPGADTQDSVDIVLAEAASDSATAHDGEAYNGVITAWNGYEVKTAELHLKKLSCVIKDPVNDRASGKAKRIPDATVRYMFDINNTGSSTATDIEIKDELAEAFTDDGDGASKTLLTPSGGRNVLKEESQDSACVCLTDPTTNASGDAQENDNVITISNITVDGGGKHTCVSFEVQLY